MNIAHAVAGRSTCDRASVGCVIVKDKRIVSTGYNGAPHGLPHCSEVGHLLVDGRCKRVVHAEANAIIHAKEDLSGSTAYVTHEPCIDCSNLLTNVGVKRVVYRDGMYQPVVFPIGFEKEHMNV